MLNFMFEVVDSSFHINYVQFYAKKVMTGLGKSSNAVQISKNVESTHSSKKLQNKDIVCASADFSSGSSSRSFYMNWVDSDENSMRSSEYGDEDIPYYINSDFL